MPGPARRCQRHLSVVTDRCRGPPSPSASMCGISLSPADKLDGALGKRNIQGTGPQHHPTPVTGHGTGRWLWNTACVPRRLCSRRKGGVLQGGVLGAPRTLTPAQHDSEGIPHGKGVTDGRPPRARRGHHGQGMLPENTLFICALETPVDSDVGSPRGVSAQVVIIWHGRGCEMQA